MKFSREVEGLEAILKRLIVEAVREAFAESGKQAASLSADAGEDRLMTVAEVMLMAKVSREAVYRYGPKPVRLSARNSRWRESEVRAWAEGRWTRPAEPEKATTEQNSEHSAGASSASE